jgi:hypothetical protein
MLTQPAKKPEQSLIKHEKKSTDTNKALTEFIAALKVGKSPKGKILDFSWITIGNKGLEILSNEALATGSCSSGLIYRVTKLMR